MGYDDLVKRLLFFGVDNANVNPSNFPIVGSYPENGTLYGTFILNVENTTSDSNDKIGCLFLSSIVTTSLDHHNPVS